MVWCWCAVGVDGGVNECLGLVHLVGLSGGFFFCLGEYWSVASDWGEDGLVDGSGDGGVARKVVL